MLIVNFLLIQAKNLITQSIEQVKQGINNNLKIKMGTETKFKNTNIKR
jgi:hypothetical protein